MFEGGPAANAGLQRGDEVIAVDQGSGFVPVAQSLADGTSSFTDLLGAADAGVQRGLRVLRNGQAIEMQLSKRTVTIDPVPDSFGTRVLPVTGTTGVGYLNLRSYISTADAQLRTAFQSFRAQDVRDYIIDLRYNGGGLVSTAELIDNLLGGDRTAADTQYTIVHSPGKSGQNSTVRFQPQAQSVRPVRIAFLTTDATASASEININAMHAWAEVAIVGSDTYGKPVGQLAFDLRELLPGPAAARHLQDGQCGRRQRLLRWPRSEHALRMRGGRHARRPDGRPRGRPDAGGAAVDQQRCLRQRDRLVRRRTGQDQPVKPVPALAATVRRRTLAARHPVTGRA